MAEKAILFDSTRCVACRACQVACKQWWELPAEVTANRGSYENPPDLSAETWNKIRFKETGQNGSPPTLATGGTFKWLFTRQACMHCTTAACVSVCPSYARTYHPLGYIAIDLERCIGCGRCVEYCPFDTPRLGKSDVSGRMTVEISAPRQVAYKCKFCEDRLEAGLPPSCVKTCPSGALRFGDRADLVKQGQARVDSLKPTNPKAYLYGENELGGLHVMYVLTEEPAVHGLPDKPKLGTYPEFNASTFPDWYRQAVASGKLPVFPPGAKPEWYLQPKLVPTAGQPEPAMPVLGGGPKIAGWGATALSGWLAFGAAGALAWVIRRRVSGNGKNDRSEKD